MSLVEIGDESEGWPRQIRRLSANHSQSKMASSLNSLIGIDAQIGSPDAAIMMESPKVMVLSQTTASKMWDNF